MGHDTADYPSPPKEQMRAAVQITLKKIQCGKFGKLSVAVRRRSLFGAKDKNEEDSSMLFKKTALSVMLACAVGAAFAAEPAVVNTDVLVIGAGGAGMAAALEAKDAGANVLIIEKMTMAGGNTVRAAGGMNAAGTAAQAKLGIKDSQDAFFTDTMQAAHWQLDPKPVREFVKLSAPAVEWLVKMGADLGSVAQLPGSSVPRAHRPGDGTFVGPEVVAVLEKAVSERKIEVRTSTAARSILTDKNGTVTGAEVSGPEGAYQIKADAVVIATGGFGADSEMVASYDPKLQGFGTTNHPGADGDGIRMAQRVGAQLIDMSNIQTHPTVNTRTGEMVTTLFRTEGAILLNTEGKRFANELQDAGHLSAAILAQPQGKAYMILDEALAQKMRTTAGGLTKIPFAYSEKSVKWLARDMKVPQAALEETLKNWRDDRTAGRDRFGRASMPLPLDQAPFYAIEVRPAVHHTVGGVRINSKAAVLNAQGKTIPGLYAAGEVTGGGAGGNLLSGNAETDVIVHGRIAGRDAAEYAKTH